MTAIPNCHSKKVSIAIRNIIGSRQFGKEKERGGAVIAINSANVSC